MLRAEDGVSDRAGRGQITSRGGAGDGSGKRWQRDTKGTRWEAGRHSGENLRGKNKLDKISVNDITSIQSRKHGFLPHERR